MADGWSGPTASDVTGDPTREVAAAYLGRMLGKPRESSDREFSGRLNQSNCYC